MRFYSALFLFCAWVAPVHAAGDLSSQINMARADQDKPSEFELLRRWLDKHPGDAAVRRRLVSLWLDISDHDMAGSALADWKNPEPGFAARTKAEIFWQRDEAIDRALAILRERVKEAPSDRATRLMLADYLARDGYREEQVAVLDKLIADKPEADLFLDRALARRLLDDPAGAVADARKAAAKDPESARIKNALPEFERLQKALTEISGIEQSLRREPASVRLRLERSLWLLYGSLPAKALVDADFCLDRTPGSVIATILRVRALSGLGKTDKASALAEFGVDLTKPLETTELLRGIFQADKLLDADPKNSGAHVTRSFHLNNDGQYRLALADCRSALNLDPASLDALNNASFASSRLGDLTSATAYARKLESLNPPPTALARVLGFLADVAFKQSNFALTIEYADRSLAAKSEPAIWKLKAAALTRLGRTTEAEAALKEAKSAGSTKK